MFGLFENKFKSPIINYKQQLNNSLKDEIIEYINWFANKLNLEVKKIEFIEEPITFQDSIVTVDKLRYVLYNPVLNKDHILNTYVFKFLDNYIIINGLRYTFVFSQTDKPITRFGTYSKDIKLSNLYRKIVFKNALDLDNINTEIKYESKFITMPLLFMLILLEYDRNYMYSYNELQNINIKKLLYELHEIVYKKFNIEYNYIEFNENIKQKKLKAANIFTINKIKDSLLFNKILSKTDELNNIRLNILNDFAVDFNTINIDKNIFDEYNIVVHKIFDREYILNLKDKPIFIKKLFYNYKVTNKQLNLLLQPTLTTKKVLSEFKALFDPFTCKILNVNDHIDFLEKYIYTTNIIEYANNIGVYTDAATKQIAIKQFILYPLIRQIAHFIFTYNIYGIERLPLKHNITFSILYKSMQIELADGHLNNPASEYAINTKITYMHRFAIKRATTATRLMTNFIGILDPIATTETKKTGANNYLVIEPILDII